MRKKIVIYTPEKLAERFVEEISNEDIKNLADILEKENFTEFGIIVHFINDEDKIAITIRPFITVEDKELKIELKKSDLIFFGMVIKGIFDFLDEAGYYDDLKIFERVEQ
jgi:hypothetical protein